MKTRISSASSIYLDANALIYFMERSDDFQEKVGGVIAHAVENNIPLFVSEIGIAECLYGTYKNGREPLTSQYQELFYEIALFQIIPTDGQKLIAAAKIGADKGLKLVDATHFLSAMEAGCDLFLTNDTRFRSSHGVEVVTLSDL
jgi:predicted nucleic acid-binding protein